MSLGRDNGKGIPLFDRFFQSIRSRRLRGFSRLLGLLRRFVSYPYVRAKCRYGAEFYLSPDDYIDGHVLASGYYESEVLEGLLPHLGAGSVFWDVGANIGLHAVTAKRLKPEATVVCFEPSPPMVSRILANAALNRVDVQVLCMGLWKSEGFLVLHSMDEGNPGQATFRPYPGARYGRQLLVHVDTGQSLVARKVVPPPTVLKIDVEGAEPEVLEGFGPVLADSRLRAVVFEDAADCLVKTTPTMDLLRRAGFHTIHALARKEATHHNLDNFLALKS